MVVKARKMGWEHKCHGAATVIKVTLRRWHHDPLAANPNEAAKQVEIVCEEMLRFINRSEPLVVLNFQDVMEFTGSSLTPIVKLAMDIKGRNGVLAVCHLPSKIRNIIASTRSDELMRVFDTEGQAVESMLLPLSE